MNPRKTECDAVDWIHVAQKRELWLAFVGTVKNLRVPLNVGYFLTR
jgi:hypothetical protein